MNSTRPPGLMPRRPSSRANRETKADSLLGTQLKLDCSFLRRTMCRKLMPQTYSSFLGKRIWLKGMRNSMAQPSALTAALVSHMPSHESSSLTSLDRAESGMEPAGVAEDEQ